MTLPFAQGASDAKLKPAPSPILAVSDSFTSAAPPTLQNLTHPKSAGTWWASPYHTKHTLPPWPVIHLMSDFAFNSSQFMNPSIYIEGRPLWQKREACVSDGQEMRIGKWRKYNAPLRMCPVITCICDGPNHNHKLYLPRSKIQTCLRHLYFSLDQRIHPGSSCLDGEIYPGFLFCLFSNSVSESWCSVGGVSS